MLSKYPITCFGDFSPSFSRVKCEELPLVAERKLQKSFKFAFPLLTGLSTKLPKNMIAHFRQTFPSLPPTFTFYLVVPARRAANTIAFLVVTSFSTYYFHICSRKR